MARGLKGSSHPESKLEQRIARVLAGRVRPDAAELLDLIRQINPTGLELPEALTQQRYQLKSQLQSLLVCRFGADLEIVPEPDRAGVVRLRHRYLDRGGAAHAIVAELAEEARSFVQRHLDTAEIEGAGQRGGGTERIPAAAQPVPTLAPEPASVDAAPWPELVHRGAAAVSDYDYEGARALLTTAFVRSGGALEAARPLGALLVEVLASYDEALALAPSLSTEAVVDPTVRALLAQAVARARPVGAARAEAERWLEGVAPAEAVGVWIVLTERALQAGDGGVAAQCLDQVRAHGTSPAEVLRLQAELQALRRLQWREAEGELEQALAQGLLEDVESSARALLEKWPDSQAARQVLMLLSEQRRRDERERLVAEAEAALRGGELARAAERAHAARMLAADTADLHRRIEHARAEVQRQRDREQVARVTAMLTGGAVEGAALLLYLQLAPRLRSEVRNSTGLLLLDWLEQAAAPSTGPRAHATVEAVQALARAEGISDPAEVLAMLAPYEGVLARVGRSRERIACAHADRAAHRHQQALAQVAETRTAFQQGEVERARGLLQETDLHALTGPEREEARALDEQIRRRAEGCRRAEELERRLEAADLLGALEQSEALRELCEDNDRGAWVARHQAITTRLQRAYCVHELRLHGDGEPLGALGVLGGTLARMTRSLPISTAVRGDAATVVTSYGSWVFLWSVALDASKLRRVTLLRTPAPIGGDLRVVAAGDFLFILGRRHMLVLEPIGMQIRSFRTLSDFVGPDDFVENAFVFPEAGYLWLCPASEERVRSVVVDLRKWRVRREIPWGAFFKPVLGGKEPLLASYGLSRDVRLFGADGSTRESLTYGDDVVDVSLPGDAGPLLALCVDRVDGPESGAGAALAPAAQPTETMVTMELAEPGSTGWRLSLHSPQADGPHLLTAAREHDLTIVAYQREEGPVRLYGLYRRGSELRRRWKAESKGGFLCLQDPARRRAFALFSTTEGCGLTELGAGAPELLGQSTDYEHRLPRLSGPFFCDTPGVDVPSSLSGPLAQLPSLPRAEAREALARLQAQYAGDPDALVAMTSLLSFEQRAEHAEFLKDRFPAHPLVPMRLADAASQRNAWDEAAEMLRRMEIEHLPQDQRCHALHLLGIVRLRSGDLDGAEEAWQQAAQSPGRCAIDRCLAWLRALRQPPEPDEQTTDPSFCGTLVRLLRRVDVLLEEGAPELAVHALEQPLIWALEERQTLARLTAAHLRLSPQGGLPLFHKALALSRFCSWHEAPQLADNLLLLKDTWNEERLATLHHEADAWLSTFSEETSSP